MRSSGCILDACVFYCCQCLKYRRRVGEAGVLAESPGNCQSWSRELWIGSGVRMAVGKEVLGWIREIEREQEEEVWTSWRNVVEVVVEWLFGDWTDVSGIWIFGIEVVDLLVLVLH
jgi:hypothetical protein